MNIIAVALSAFIESLGDHIRQNVLLRDGKRLWIDQYRAFRLVV